MGFRATDTAGNVSQPVYYTVKLDNTAPAVGAVVDDYVRSSDNTVLITWTGVSDAGSQVNPESGGYAIDGGARQDLETDFVAPVRLPLGLLSEGTHTLTLYADDQVGNAGFSAFDIVADRTPPTMTALTTSDEGGEFDGGAVRASTNVIIGAAATDLAGGEDGHVAGFEYLISQDPPAVFANGTGFDQTATVSDLPVGTVYLWVRAVDGAGNASAHWERVFTVDTSTPMAPVVTSISHPWAASTQDAVPSATAVFTVSPATATAGAVVTVSSYDYSLEKGDLEMLTGSVAAAIETRIEIPDLADNAEEEFYTLHVRSVGANGVQSGSATQYTFRVDTTPPRELSVFAITHANPEVWYRASTADLQWNRPLDMTGISTYYLWADVAAPVLPSEPDALPTVDLTAWTMTNEESALISLAPIVGGAYGTVHVSVCAEDFAGNRQVDSLVLRFDEDAPRIDQTPPVTATADAGQRSVTVSWGTPLDANAAAGDGRIQVAVSEILSDGNVDQPLATKGSTLASGSEVFEGLDGTAGYYITVTLVDGAGNGRTYDASVSMSGEPLPPLSIPFDVGRDGFRLTGVREPGGTVRDTVLTVPASLELLEWSETDSAWAAADSIAMDSVEFDGSDPQRATADAETSYQMEVAGFLGEYQGLAFDMSTGLEAATLRYQAATLTAEGQPTTQIVEYAGVRILPPPRSGFAAGGWSMDTLAVPLMSGAGSRIWSLLGATSSGFVDYTWRLRGGRLDTTELRDTYDARVYVGEDEETRIWSVAVPEARVGPSGVAQDAAIEGGFYIESGDARLYVRNALLRGDRIVVLDADLLASLNGIVSAVLVSNLSLSHDGILRQESGFRMGAVTWTDSAGTTFTVSEVTIVSGFFLLGGTLTTADGRELNYTGISLTASGPSYDIGAHIPVFSATVHGFSVTSTSALLGDDLVVLPQATIALPVGFGGGTGSLLGLELRLSDLAVLVAGQGTDAFSFATAYGGSTSVSAIELDESGLYADGTVPLPSVVGGGALPFSRLGLEANNSLVQSEPDTAQRVWTIDGHSVGVTGTTYDGARVAVGAASVTVGPGVTAVELVFAGMEVTATGISAAGTTSTTVSLDVAGFDVGLAALKLDASGLKGPGVVELDPAFEVRWLSFPEFELLPAAGFDSGYAEEGAYVGVSGWLGTVHNARLEASGLTVERLDVEVFPEMGDAVFTFANLAVSADGTVLSCGTDTTPRSFLSRQGFATQLIGSTLGAGGIVGDGLVTLAETLGSTNLAFEDAALGADGRLTAASAGTFVYQVGGWSVEGSGASIDAWGLTVAESRIVVPNTGLSMELGQMVFRPSGELYEPARLDDTLDLPLFAGAVHVEGYTFDEGGLSMQAWVVLPAAFGGDSIFFDGLMLHPDGVMTTTVPVSEATIVVGGSLGLVFVFRDVLFDQSGLYIGEAELRLPAALENRTLRVTNLRIGSTGEISFSNLSTDPIDLFGFTLFIDGIGFQNNELSFMGAVMCPESMPGQLSSQVLRIDEFRFNLTTRDLAFSVVWDGELLIPFGDLAQLVITDLGVEVEPGQDGEIAVLITALEAKLDLPPEIPVGSVAIQGVKFSPTDGSFVFDNVTIEQVSLEKFGLDFVLTQIVIASNFDMTFTGVGTLPDTLPDPLAGATLTVDKFEVLHTGAIGTVQGSLSGLDGSLFDTLVLEDGLVSIDKGANHFLIGVAGHILFGPQFPSYLQGKGVRLVDFVLDPVAGEVVAFDASTDPLYLPLMGGAAVEDAVLGARLDPETDVFEVSIAGDIVLPSGLPEALREGRIEIAAFRFGLDGSLQELDATLSLPGDRELFGGVLMRDVAVALKAEEELLVFGVTGGLALGASFPVGLAGLSCTVSDLSFDSNGNVRSLAASLSLPEQELFGVLTLRGGSVSFAKAGTSNLTVTVAGQFVLPSTFPQGLAGLVIGIDEFTIDSTGTILALRAGASNIDVSIFGVLNLEDGAIDVSGASQTGLTFSASGDLVLPSTLPGALGGARLGVETLVLSTTDGLIDFRAGLTQELSFPLFAGITASFTSLEVGSEGFSLAGNVKFPSTFPTGLADLTISLDELAMTWGGQITAISAGITVERPITLGGFTVTIDDLMFHADSVTLGSCVIGLPAVLGGQSVELRNARFDRDGTFSGEVALESLTVDVAGFSLVLSDLGFDVPNKTLTVGVAELKGPAFLGSFTIKVNGVSVGPSGLALSGGEFRIPDFTVAGGLGFRDVFVNFSLAEGQYLIEGGGSAIIPGAGTFTAYVSFVNVSSTYPIGLKRAEFRYRVSGLGLPLGPTGLYLNEIEGGIAFGPPDEIPPRVRGMFASGTRIKLGLGVQDGTFGTVFRGRAQVWVDVTNWAFAFQGDMTILNGLVNAQVIAALSNRVFYGYVGVSLTFVRGEVEFYIFEYNGPRLSGSGSIQIVVPQGFVWNGRWLKIPKQEWLSPRLGAEFGLFQNGSTGFKGFVQTEWLGQVGVFLAKGQPPVFGGVSQYVLYSPFSASVMPGVRSVAAGPRYESRSYRQAPVGTDVHLFRVPGQASAASAQGNAPRASARPGAVGDAVPGPGPTPAEADRLTFAVGYAEGDPVATAVSPSGRRYSSVDPDVEVVRTDGGMLFFVMEPEPGEWSLEVAGVPADAYEAAVFGMAPVPEITVATPTLDGEILGDAFVVRGHTQNAGDGAVTVYASRERDTYVGRPVGQGVVAADGSFSIDVAGAQIADDEPYVFVGVHVGDEPERRGYASGSLRRVGPRPLSAIQGLLASDAGDGVLELRFVDPNGQTAVGFAVYTDRPASDKSERIEIGYLTEVSVPGFDAGETVQVSVTALDGTGAEGPRSQTVEVVFASPPPEANQVVGVAADPLDVLVEETVPAFLRVSLEDVEDRDDAFGYLTARIVTLPEGLGVVFGENPLRVPGDAAGAVDVPLMLLAREGMAPGEYTVVLEVANLGARESSAQTSLVVSVDYPPVEVTGVGPSVWNTRDEVELRIQGSGFHVGTRVFLDEMELGVAERWTNGLTAVVAAGVSAGEHTVRVQGPGGDSASFPVTVVEPSYSVVGLLDRVQVTAGQPAHLYLTVQGHEGWNERALLAVTATPAGWWAELSPSAIGVGEEAEVQVTVPVDAAAGEYDLEVTADNGVVAPLLVEVNAAPAPRIEYLSRTVVLPGDEIVIYGSGFGGSGSVALGQGTLAISAWTPERLVVVVDEESETGELAVHRGELSSNAVAVTVLQTGLSMYGPRDALVLQPGEDRVVEIAISGRAREVLLELDAGDVPATLSRTSVVPNAVVELTLAAPAVMGRYAVLVRGRTGNLTREIAVEVVVGNALTIDTESLPEALEDVPYLARIHAINGVGALRYEVLEGKLPLGIGLGTGGELRGTPAEPGETSFRVKVTDAEGHAASRQLSIMVGPNAWAQTRMDGGQGSYNPVPSPADSRVRWRSGAVAGAHSVLAAAERVLVVGSESVVALDRDTGRVVWRQEGEHTQAFVAQEQLWLLDAAGNLSVCDARYGGGLWARSGVLAASTDGALAALVRDGTLDMVEVSSGNLVETWDIVLQPSSLLWREGRLYQASGSELREIVAGEAVVGYADPVAQIVRAAADEQGFVLAMSDGRLVALDAESAVVGERDGVGIATEMALAGQRVLALTPGTLVQLDRANLGAARETVVAGDTLASAARKDFIAGEQELVAVNRTAGSVIWRIPGSFVDLALAGSKLYALKGGGSVLSLNAPDNLASPVTHAQAEPVVPDGENGWYRSTPNVSLVATDAETEAASTTYRVGSSEPMAYGAPFALEDGTTHVVYWSVDTDGLREPDQIAMYNVDTVAPTAAGSLQGEMGPEGWYWSAVGVTLTGSDTTSGVDRLEYALDGGAWTRYVATVVVDAEGEHSVVYRSVDRAGNASAVGSLAFSVDLVVPLADAHTTVNPGLGVVYVEARDTANGSGVEAIEYRLNDGEIQAYVSPVLIADEGTHSAGYRVRDVSGRESAWQQIWLTVEGYAEHGLIRDLDYWRQHVPGRAVVEDVEVGERLYGGVQDPENKMDSLPEGVAGSWFLRLGEQDRRCDENVLLSFRAGADLVVTLLVHEKARANMWGWALVEEDHPVEGEHFFRGGAKVYVKSFHKWDRVRVPGPRLAQGRGASTEGWPTLVFVKADTRGQIRIVEPEPGLVLRPEQEVRLLATNLDAESGVTAGWRVRYDHGQWSALTGETLTLPYTETELKVELEATLYAASGQELGRRREDYRVVNGAGIRLVDPAPGGVLVGGTVVPLVVDATDMRGVVVPQEAVRYRGRVEGGDWQAIPSVNALQVPAGLGAYELEATWTEGGEHERSRVWKLRIDYEPRAMEILFGQTEGESSRGDVEGEWPSGRIYGFTTDHRDRDGSYWLAVPGEWPWPRGSYVELQEGQAFRAHVGVGRMRVEMTVGSFDPPQHGSTAIQLNGKTIALPTDRQKRLVDVVTEVMVTDGVLVIRGTRDLPLVRLSVLELPEDAPPVSDAVEKRRGEVIVSRDPPDGWWDRWDRWDDGNWGRGW